MPSKPSPDSVTVALIQQRNSADVRTNLECTTESIKQVDTLSVVAIMPTKTTEETI